MPHVPRVRWLFLLLVLCALPSVPVFAQMETATLSGVITDPNGRVVPDTEVIATRIETGGVVTNRTNGAGIYSFTGLMPGHYHVTVRKAGFKEIAIKDLELFLQDKLEQNFTLEIGSVSESVTVNASAPLLNTTDASIGTTVDQNYVANMPLNGRSFQDLILLTPGIVTQTPQNPATQLGGTGEFSVNGQRPEGNVYTVDGVSANLGVTPGEGLIQTASASGSVSAATALGTTQALVSVDDLQEFRVQSSSYSAEYGRSPGGQFSFETKSGTNQWHGTAYDYLRNGAVDANDWFNDYFGTPEPNVRQNDFGGTLGAPVWIPGLYNGKDRTFFFVSYEGLRLAQPQAASVNNVPDMALRASAPAPLDQALNAFPVPNGSDDVANGIAQYIASWSNPSSINSTSVRLDHLVNDKLRLFFRFSDTPSKSVIRGSGLGATPSELITTNYISRTYTAGATSAFTNRLSNQFRLNYSSNQVTNSTVIDSFGGNTPTNLAQIAGLGSGVSQSVVLLFGGYDIGIAQAPQAAVQRQWNIVDTMGFTVGHHQLRYGVDFRRVAPVATPFSPSVSYRYIIGKSFVESNSAFAIADSLAPSHPLYVNFSAFAQDEWRVSPRLSLSFGLRWEVNPAPSVTQGLRPYTVQGAGPSTWTLAPQGTPLWQTTWYNFAPRLGVAYVLRATPGYETVVRGGGGIFYDTGQQGGSVGFQGPGFSSGLQFHPFVPFPLPVAEANPPIVNPPVAPFSLVFAFPSHLQLPYTGEWNGTLEQALGDSQALTISYVGSHAARLLKTSEISGTAVGNPTASAFQVQGSGLTSDFEALQVQFRRRLSRGLTALASYTYSHCIDFGSQNYFVGYQRGNCDFDVRHNFTAAFSYDLPNVRQDGFLGAVLHHWGLDDRFTARTGFPVLLQGLPTIDPATGNTYFSGLDMVPGQPTYIHGAECAAVYDNGLACPGGRAINPTAFVLPTGCTPAGCANGTPVGDSPRNFTRGFGAWQMDLAVRRDFPIHDRLSLQFRAEAFNVFNHPNFGTINFNYCSPDPASPSFTAGCTFGQATGTLASTLGILSPLYQMGGPRSMQFALKLLF